ncbi:hypothetical protein G653_04449 [Candidatus Liberibacter americanus PW_SP]|nr:hypothetical protein G653_04449 [Candidatus Liberibacter americanus PW_SP]
MTYSPYLLFNEPLILLGFSDCNPAPFEVYCSRLKAGIKNDKQTRKDNIYNSPLECRVILLEYAYESLEKKVDKLSNRWMLVLKRLMLVLNKYLKK